MPATWHLRTTSSHWKPRTALGGPIIPPEGTFAVLCLELTLHHHLAASSEFQDDFSGALWYCHTVIEIGKIEKHYQACSSTVCLAPWVTASLTPSLCFQALSLLQYHAQNRVWGYKFWWLCYGFPILVWKVRWTHHDSYITRSTLISFKSVRWFI